MGMAMAKIAVVGSGIAGLAVAHILDPHHEVVLFEADRRLGGHANTVTVEDPSAGPIGVDTGFIVHNDRNYPNLVRLLGELGVETQDAEMSFGVYDPQANLSYRATNLSSLFCDRGNLARLGFWRLLADIPRFWRNASKFLTQPDPAVTLDQFLADGNYSDQFVNWHLIPMGAAIWSADPQSFGQFPAVSLFSFLQNHGLLGLGDRPQWKTIVGGSQHYVDALVAGLTGRVHDSCPVYQVARAADKVELRSSQGLECFDDVVLCCHPDQSLDILVDASPEEKSLLEAFKYQPNTAVLHTDQSLLSPVDGARSAWNYRVDPLASVPTVTYDLTRLQNLPGTRRYLVSLNMDSLIDPAQILGQFNYSHPVFDKCALDAQGQLGAINGVDKVYFAGAWAAHGFHEDGLNAAINVAAQLGCQW